MLNDELKAELDAAASASRATLETAVAGHEVEGSLLDYWARRDVAEKVLEHLGLADHVIQRTN